MYSFCETCQWLKFPLNGLWAEQGSPVVGLLPWIQHVNRMPRNRLPRVMKHYSLTAKRNQGRPLKRLLDTWDRNGPTSGPTPWWIYDDNMYSSNNITLKLAGILGKICWCGNKIHHRMLKCILLAIYIFLLFVIVILIQLLQFMTLLTLLQRYD
jgi:hypothetical protein